MNNTLSKYCKLLWIICLCLVANMSMAQEVKCRHYGISDGLFNLQTRKVIEMPDGRILVQLEGMFDIFDGERFHNLEYDRTKVLNISSFINTDYYFDSNGLLWVKDNSHLFVINVDTYEFVDAKRLFEKANLNSDITNCFIDHNGDAILETEDHKVMAYDWKSPAKLLFQIMDRNSEDKFVQLVDAQKTNNDYALFFSNGKFVCRNGDGSKTLHEEQLIEPVKGHMLKALRWNEHELVVRNPEGLMTYDVGTWEKKQIISDLHVFEFKTACIDKGTMLYASANDAVYVFDSNLQVQDTIKTLVDETTGIANNDNLQGVLVDRQNGLWVATFNNGLFFKPDVNERVHFTPVKEGRDIVLKLFFSDMPSVANLPIQVTSIFNDRQQQTWLTTRNDGLIMVDRSSKALNRFGYNDVQGLWGSVPFIRQIDKNRYLTCNRLNRLAILYKNEKILLNITDKYQKLMQFRNMVAVTEIEGGFLVGTQNGFFVFDTRRMKPDIDRCKILNENPFSDKCNCLLTEKNNVIWIGTQNGLIRFDEAKQEIVRFSTKEGLPNNCVQSMVKDNDGNIWIATMGGICRMTDKEGKTQFLSIPESSDKEVYKFSERMAFLIGDSLVFITDKGYVSLAPNDVQLPAVKLKPRLMSFLANDSTVVFAHDKDNQVSISLKYDENYVNMDISALNYAYPHNTLYRYRINQLGEDWMMPEMTNGKMSISFSALEPGNYTILVQAAMQGQEWGPELKIKLRVMPPWWKTWWAYSLYVLLFLTVVATIAYLYIKSQRDKLAIEQKEAHIRQLLEQIKVKSQIPDNIEVEHNEEILVSKEDELFLQKAMECVEKNMENPDYGVEAFSSDMAMDRTTLYRHLQAALGKSPKDFIRTVRLKKAAELLRSGKYNVGETADMVGFSNRKSFAKFFKEAFGTLPSNYS